MFSFRYLRTDEEIDSNAPLWHTLRRSIRQMWDMIRTAFLHARGVSRLKLPYWIFRYYWGLAFSPMRSCAYTSIRVAINDTGLETTYVARQTQSDFFVTQNIFLRRIYDLPYQDWCDEIHYIVDLGANIGLSSLYFLTRFPEASLVCVEPVAENVEILKKNVPADRATVLCAAVSGKSGQVTFGMSEWWGSGSAVKSIWATRQSRKNRVEARSAVQRMVLAISMPDLVRTSGLSRIDIIKIDIEGAEFDVFSNDLSWLDIVNLIVIEIHDKYIDGIAVRRAIESRGFSRIECESKDCEVYRSSRRISG